jgi:MbtH protein
MSEEYKDWQDGDLKVVKNDKGEYSIWPLERETPAGWYEVGCQGKKADCLEYINRVWDMKLI